MTIALSRDEMTALRDCALAELRAAATEPAVVDTINRAHGGFFGGVRLLRPGVPVELVVLDASVVSCHTEACRRDCDSLEAFRLRQLVDILTEAASVVRRFRIEAAG